MASRRNATRLPGLRPVGRIPGHATQIQYLRNGRVAYYHPFVQPGGGRVKMIALSNGGVMLKGPHRIHADDREPGFERYTRRNAPRQNPGGGSSILTFALLGGAAWFLLRTPADGSPSLLSTLLSHVTGAALPAPAPAASTLAQQAYLQGPLPPGTYGLASGDSTVPAATSYTPGSNPPPGGWGPFAPLLYGSGYYGPTLAIHPPH
jgi:hypothetical protein